MGKGLNNAIKFDGIEDNASTDQTASELKTLYDANSDTNVLSDALQTKITNINENLTWTGPTLLNGWVEYGTIWGVAGYAKDASGTVYLRGLIKNGTIAQTVFTLPVGYRPSGRKIISVLANNAQGRLDVLPTGEVNAQAGSTTWFSLSCCFKAEQ